MQYKFPIINTIDDVLPAIKGHDEFIIAERPFGTVINYHYVLPNSFDDPIRRECRGIIFDNSGKIMSRPFHKFFNLGEKEETFAQNLDFSNTVIMEKLDGSMIRPIYFNDGSWNLGTKMGITDVSNQAWQWLLANKDRYALYAAAFEEARNIGVTLLFEWCSNQQRIVIDHKEENLILLAIRDNHIGNYLSRWYVDGYSASRKLPAVKVWNNKSIDDLLELSKKTSDMEGWVVRFPNGHKVKVKVDWYVNLHKAKEAITREKYVIEAILDEFIDDLKPKLLPDDLKRVEEFEADFLTGISTMHAHVMYWNSRMSLKSRKEIALDTSVPQWVKTILFSLMDKKIDSIRDGIKIYLKKATKTQALIDENRGVWLGAKYSYNGVVDDE